MKQIKETIALLLLAALLCGCGLSAAPAGPDPETSAVSEITEPEQTADPLVEETPEPVETPDPEEIREEEKRQERLASQQDGFVWDKGYLCVIDETGNVLKNTYVGVLYFGEDGRYTSGSKKLDRLVARVIRQNTEEGMTRMEKLKAMYDYTRDNLHYVGFGNHELTYEPAHGENGWMPELAVYALENGIGNCYHFSALFAALARGVGYQAYATAGVIGAEEQQHGWVEILDEDGNIWFCDPETEYSRMQWLQQKHDLFYKAEDEIGATTGLGYLKMRDPFEAEAKEARMREQGFTDPNLTTESQDIQTEQNEAAP